LARRRSSRTAIKKHRLEIKGRRSFDTALDYDTVSVMGIKSRGPQNRRSALPAVCVRGGLLIDSDHHLAQGGARLLHAARCPDLAGPDRSERPGSRRGHHGRFSRPLKNPGLWPRSAFSPGCQDTAAHRMDYQNKNMSLRDIADPTNQGSASAGQPARSKKAATPKGGSCATGRQTPRRR
jgi:hypothetical protein